MSKSELGYSDYLQKKHRFFFRYLDRNSDGRLYREDILKRVDKFSALNVLNDEESAYTRSCWIRWCNHGFPLIDAEKGVSEDEFVDIQRGFRNSGKWTEIMACVEGIYNVLFDRLDANRDGRISRDELKMYYKNLGGADDKFVDKVFKKLDLNHDGEVIKSEFIKAGLEFWSSEDESGGYEILYDVSN